MVKIYNISPSNELEEFKVFRFRETSNYARNVVKKLNKEAARADPNFKGKSATKYINFEKFVIEKDQL